MSNNRIHLPDQPYYRLEELAKAIEGFPPQRDIKKGIDSISRKFLPKFFFMKKPDYSFRLKGFAGSLPLTDIDRAELSLLLPQLPEVTDNMSDSEIDNFFDEYYKIEDRPNWEPDIKTPSDRQNTQRDYDERIAKHCENFILKVQSGHYHLFDADSNVLRGSQLNPFFAQKHALVSREDASKYLKQLELDFIISSAVESQLSAAESKSVSVERWTPEKANELRERRKKFNSKETAAYYGISVSRMNVILAKYPKPENSHLEVLKSSKKKKKSSHSNSDSFGNLDNIWK